MDLDVLPFPEAMEMLVAVLATSDPHDRRVLDDPLSAETLVRLCGGLPLALRVTAALLAAEPDRSVVELAADLADDRRRLEELHYSGVLAVRAAFDLSYRHLEPRHARLFRLMSLNTGPEIGVDAVVALAGTSVHETRGSLRELMKAHLVQSGSSPGRWRMHDLLRLYAMDKAISDPEHQAASIRLLDHYENVNHGAYLAFDDPTTTPEEREWGSRFTGRLEALRWADDERVNLVAAVAAAVKAERYSQAVRLSLDLFYYLDLRHHWNDLLATNTLALAAARRIGDRVGEGRVLNHLGNVNGMVGRFDEALECHREASAIHRDSGYRVGEGQALNRIGQIYSSTGRAIESIDILREALVIFRELEMPSLEAKVLHSLAVAHRLLGRWDAAIDYHLQDLRICRDLGRRTAEGRILGHLGVVYCEMGQYEVSVDHHRQNIAIAREVGDRNGAVVSLARLGVTYREWHRYSEAADCLREALAFFIDSGDRYAEATVLQDLGTTLRRAGDPEEAVLHWTGALEVFESLPGAGPAASAAEVRALLATNE